MTATVFFKFTTLFKLVLIVGCHFFFVYTPGHPLLLRNSPCRAQNKGTAFAQQNVSLKIKSNQKKKSAIPSGHYEL